MKVAIPVLMMALAAGTAAADYGVDIDFDTAPGGAPLADGTEVDTLYAGLGVEFAAVGANKCSSHVYANSNRTPGDSGSLPNVVSTCGASGGSDISESFQGSVGVLLASGASQVCIKVLLPADVAVLRIYDASEALLDTVFTAGGEGDLCATSPTPIRSATFSGSGGSYARFDDLAITFLPEPSAALAGVVALAAVASRRRA
jgi:hypothetical protein